MLLGSVLVRPPVNTLPSSTTSPPFLYLERGLNILDVMLVTLIIGVMILMTMKLIVNTPKYLRRR